MHAQRPGQQDIVGQHLQRLARQADDGAGAHAITQGQQVLQMRQPLFQGVEAVLQMECRVGGLMLQDIAGRPLLPQIGVLLPALVAEHQQDIHLAVEDPPDLRNCLAHRLRRPRDIASLQRNGSDAGAVDMRRELNNTLAPVDIARHLVVEPHRAIGAVLHAGAGDLDNAANNRGVAEMVAPDPAGLNE